MSRSCLIGDEPGIPEAASEMGVRNVREVERDEKGIPIVRSVMQIGHDHSDSPVLCFANADMILMSDVVTAARQACRQSKDFLLVGQRWNLDLNEPFNFERRLGVSTTGGSEQARSILLTLGDRLFCFPAPPLRRRARLYDWTPGLG